ncbi:glutamyl aminopeptidase, partial [Streptococcus pyogenes]
TSGLPAIGDIIFDAGFTSKEEAWKFGVRPGNLLVPKNETTLTANGKNIISKAWDNRYGVLMVAELLENLSDQNLPN